MIVLAISCVNDLCIVEAYENQETGIGVQNASLSITEAEQLKRKTKELKSKYIFTNILQ